MTSTTKGDSDTPEEGVLPGPSQERSGQGRIDPDPWLLASVALQSAAVLLQLVQIAKSGPAPMGRTVKVNADRTHLARIEESLEDLDRAIRKAERIVRREAQNPEREFYEVGFRISLGIMKFEAKQHREYSTAVTETLAKLGALALWVGQLIAADQPVVREIGSEIQAEVGDAASRLNQLMETGGPNEAILAESKAVRDACHRAVRSRLDDRSNG